jgi:rare lipoprotein A
MVLFKQVRTKKLIMRRSITALFLFTIVALVSSQSQIINNQKTSIQQSAIQKTAASRDTHQKPKVVIISARNQKRYDRR